MNFQENTTGWRSGVPRCSLGAVLILGLAFCSVAISATNSPDPLQEGFNRLYNLSFDAAHRSFQSWEQAHPADPRSPAFDAAAYLFSEFDHLHILQSEFFVNDRNFKTATQLTPDPAAKAHFESALNEAGKRAEARLKIFPDDPDALFAKVLRLGLKADYVALIEKHEFQALSEIKDARQTAQTLLARNPRYYDAYLALGVENYLLSQKPAPIRWFLHVGGAQTDKDTGLANLRITAAKGRYLQPYAELLLAVAALRDKNDAEARRLLSELATRFPGNLLYREELNKIRN
jgi:hypothetical protein